MSNTQNPPIIQHYKGQPFLLEATYDGDFWFVKIYELKDEQTDAERVWRFEYKLNHPKDSKGACLRAWEIFQARHLT